MEIQLMLNNLKKYLWQSRLFTAAHQMGFFQYQLLYLLSNLAGDHKKTHSFPELLYSIILYSQVWNCKLVFLSDWLRNCGLTIGKLSFAGWMDWRGTSRRRYSKRLSMNLLIMMHAIWWSIAVLGSCLGITLLSIPASRFVDLVQVIYHSFVLSFIKKLVKWVC